MVSESEEMYLVSIARAQEKGIEGSVPLTWIAEALDIQPVSVNQMIRKLEENGLVVYTPYKGVDLTTLGRQQANQVLRGHRLWEVFLVEHLKIAAEEVNTLACRMEHIFPDAAIEKLAVYLGNPVICPDGQPIPPPAFDQPLDHSRSLSEIPVPTSGKVTRIEADSAIRSFVKNNGITVGSTLTALGKGHQGDCLIANEQGGTVHLSSAIASTIYLQVED
jgi:DtxR family Mn-dependent transcriptional regulator